MFRKENWLAITLLILVTFGAVVMYPIAAPVLLIIITVPVTIINGICKGTLWRDLYVKAFPDKLFLGFIYPAIGFAIWHNALVSAAYKHRWSCQINAS